MMLTRRGFLTGTLVAAGAAAGSALLRATPEEIQAFGKPLLGPVTIMDRTPTPNGLAQAGELVFNHKGDIIGIIDRMTVNRNPTDVTGWGDSWQHYIGGLLEVEYHVIGSGPGMVRTYRTDINL